MTWIICVISKFLNIYNYCEFDSLKYQAAIHFRSKIAGKYGIMVDSTQDVTTKDQCCISVRYVVDFHVHEKMLALINTSFDTTAQGLFDAIYSTTENFGISLKELRIADDFVGASNMRSEYAGLQAKLRELNPAYVHTWCYSHVLNLVISHSCTALASVSFINLLQSLYVFFEYYYKRMAVWKKMIRR